MAWVATNACQIRKNLILSFIPFLRRTNPIYIYINRKSRRKCSETINTLLYVVVVVVARQEPALSGEHALLGLAWTSERGEPSLSLSLPLSPSLPSRHDTAMSLYGVLRMLRSSSEAPSEEASDSFDIQTPTPPQALDPPNRAPVVTRSISTQNVEVQTEAPVPPSSIKVGVLLDGDADHVSSFCALRCASELTSRYCSSIEPTLAKAIKEVDLLLSN